MMKTLIGRRTLLLFISLVFLSWNTTTYAVVAPETETSYKMKNGSFKPKSHITRAEAAEQFALALELAIPEKESVYNDVGGSHRAKNYIAAVTKAGLFHGYPDGSFKPDQALTRAKMAKVLVIAYKPGGSAKGYFTDTSSSWAKDYISTLAKNRIAKGYPDHTFKPEEPITRAHFSVLLIRASDEDIR